MEANTKNNFYALQNKNISTNDKLECNNQFRIPNINNNILPKGNNINIDILSEVQLAQDNLNNELQDVKKNVYLPYSNSNKKEIPNQVLLSKEEKINNENNKDVNKRKNKNTKTNSGKTIYKDIPLTKFFQ